MNVMSASPVEPADLLDLKFLPAWVKEPGATNHYEHYTAEETSTELRNRDRGGRHKDRAFRSRERGRRSEGPGSKRDKGQRDRMPRKGGVGDRGSDRSKNRHQSDRVAHAAPKPFEGTIRFLPRQN